jgi:hypothetical protein
MIGKSMQAMQTLMITSVTRHQQRFSTGMIGVAWRFPGRNPETGVAMRRELVYECVCSLFNNLVHIYSLETFYFI